MPADPVRDAAIDVLLRVEEGRARLNDSLEKTLRRKGSQLSARGRRFLSQLVYGTVRHQRLCDTVYEKLLTQPPKNLPVDIRLVLRMGVFQSLFCNQVTFPAMVHTSVDLAKKRGHAGLAKVTNAVLRKVPQSLDEIQFPDPGKDMAAFLAVRYSLPSWLAMKWVTELDDESALEVARASAEEAPLCIRANPAKTSPAELVATLHKAGITAELFETVPGAAVISDGRGVISTKSFQHGDFTVQDIASMLPTHLLGPENGDRVADLCAAPGTKATQIAEQTECSARVFGIDLVPWRLERVVENVERLGLSGIHLAAADANRPPFREGSFDRVLLDAPCSGLGTLRRHPEIKWRLRPRSLRRLGEQQRALLRSAIGLCKNGGVLVYSVCTFNPEETDAVVDPFIDEGIVTPEDGPEWLSKWRISQGKYRTLPGKDPLDGFFLTRLRKRP